MFRNPQEEIILSIPKESSEDTKSEVSAAPTVSRITIGKDKSKSLVLETPKNTSVSVPPTKPGYRFTAPSSPTLSKLVLMPEPEPEPEPIIPSTAFNKINSSIEIKPGAKKFEKIKYLLIEVYKNFYQKTNPKRKNSLKIDQLFEAKNKDLNNNPKVLTDLKIKDSEYIKRNNAFYFNEGLTLEFLIIAIYMAGNYESLIYDSSDNNLYILYRDKGVWKNLRVEFNKMTEDQKLIVFRILSKDGPNFYISKDDDSVSFIDPIIT